MENSRNIKIIFLISIFITLWALTNKIAVGPFTILEIPLNKYFLALFSIILIGTLLYYNLSVKLLNNQIRTLEYFEEDDICQPIRELIAYPDAYDIYELKDETSSCDH